MDVEHLLQRAATSRGNVRLVDDCKVDGLLGRERVRGARVSRGGAEEAMSAELVVDAMGRGSPSIRWLEEAAASRARPISACRSSTD